MSRTLLLLAALLLAAYAAPVAEGIARRQDQVVPSDRYSSISVSQLRAYLESLRGLNDSVVDSYVDAIEYELDRGNYTGAQVLLEQLQQYLDEKYGGELSGLDPEIAKSIAAVNSVENITGDGAVIDNAELLQYYSSIENDPGLLGIAEKLREGKYLTGEEIEELNRVLEEIGSLGAAGEPVDLGGLRGLETESPGETGLGETPGLAAPQAPRGAGVPGAPGLVDALLPMLLAALAAAALYLYRGSLRSLVEPLKTRIYEAVAAATVLRRTRDPVARLYARLLLAARLYGRRRMRWETPREFLEKLRDTWLWEPGRLVTELYEKRFYGGLGVDPVLVEEAARKLRPVRGRGRGRGGR